MRKYYFSLTLFLLSLTLSAQTVKLHQGTKFIPKKKFDIEGLVASDNSGYFVTQRGAKGFSVLRTLSFFNTDLKLMSDVPLQPMLGKEDLDFVRLVHSNGRLILFSTLKDKKRSKKVLYYQTINKSTLALNNDLKSLGEVDFFSFFKTGNFSVETSPDVSKILVVKDYPWEKEANRKTGLMVYDQDMNLLWEKDITIPYQSGRFFFQKFTLSNKGLLTMHGELSEVLNDGMGFPISKLDNHYKVFVINKEGISAEFDVNVPRQYIKDFELRITEEENIICAGFYNESPKSISLDGSYFTKINPVLKKIMVQSVKDFPTEVITRYASEKRGKRLEKKEEKGKDLELYNYSGGDMMVRKDGGSYLVAEQYDVDKPTDRTGVDESVDYFYWDILVLSFNKEGVIEWYEKIPKLQRSVNENKYSSYVWAAFNNELFFFYNDHIENNDLWKADKLKNFSKGADGCVTMVKIGKDGKQERKTLDNKKLLPLITPKECKQLSPKEVIFFNSNKVEYWFSRLLAE